MPDLATLRAMLASYAKKRWREVNTPDPEITRSILHPTKEDLITLALSADVGSGRIAEVGERALLKALKKGGAISSDIFKGVSPQAATKLAESGAHLKKVGEDVGQPYVGAPRNVTNKKSLNAMRKEVDRLVDAGAWNAPWYSRAREAISEVSESPEQAKLLARGGAAYSPQASPSMETNSFLKQHNAKMISGTDVKPGMPATMENVKRAYVPNEQGGFDIAPENIKLSEKTGPYALGKDPTVNEDDLVQAVNDIWNGRVYGYTNADGTLFDRGFSPQEHGFLTGEGILAAERAQARGTEAVPGEPFHWNPNRAQAASWGAAREEAALAKNAELPLNKQRTAEEIRDEAMLGVDDAINTNTAYVTPEYAPGKATGHMAGFEDLPQEVRDEFSRSMIRAGGDRNKLFSAMGMYQKPITPVQGSYVNAAGELESNIADVARPIVSRSGQGAERAISDPERAAMRAAMRTMAATRAQEGVGMNMFHERLKTIPLKDLSGAQISGSAEDLARAKAALEKEGLDTVLVGENRLNVGQFGEPTLGGKEIQARIDRALMNADIPESTMRRGQWENDLEMAPWGEQGSGDVTRWMMEGIEDPRISRGVERIDESGFPAQLAAQKAIAAQFAREHGLPTRPDVDKLLGILSQPNGFQKLRAYIREYGTIGLPVALLSAVGLGAQSSESESR